MDDISYCSCHNDKQPFRITRPQIVYGSPRYAYLVIRCMRRLRRVCPTRLDQACQQIALPVSPVSRQALRGFRASHTSAIGGKAVADFPFSNNAS